MAWIVAFVAGAYFVLALVIFHLRKLNHDIERRLNDIEGKVSAIRVPPVENHVTVEAPEHEERF